MLNYQERQNRVAENKITGLMELMSNQSLKNEDFDSGIENIGKLKGTSAFTEAVGNIYQENLKLEKQNVEKFNELYSRMDTIEKNIRSVEPNDKSEWTNLKDDFLSSMHNMNSSLNKSQQLALRERMTSLDNIRSQAERQFDTELLRSVLKDKKSPLVGTETQQAEADVLSQITSTPVVDDLKSSIGANVISQTDVLDAEQKKNKKLREQLEKVTPTIDKYGGYDPGQVSAIQAATKSIANMYSNVAKLSKKGDDGTEKMMVIIPSASIYTDAKSAVASKGTDFMKQGYEDLTRGLLSLIPKQIVDDAFEDLKVEDIEGNFGYIDEYGQQTTGHLKNPKSRYDSNNRTRIEWTEAYLNFAKDQMPKEEGGVFGIGATKTNPYTYLVKERFETDKIATKLEMGGVTNIAQQLYDEPLMLLKKQDKLIKDGTMLTPKFDNYQKVKVYRP
jgi:hypothetical protein